MNNRSAWNTAFLWSGIKALPTWAVHDDIETQGTMFSRQFVITFEGNTKQIEEWVKIEPALQGLKSEDLGNSTYRYILRPQDGAQWAEVKIDFVNNRVTIRTYWS